MVHASKTTQPGKPLKPEYLFFEVWEGTSTPVLIILVNIRLPDVPIRSDRKLVSLLRTTCSNYKHNILLGNWNADMRQPESSDTRFNQELINELSLKLIQTSHSHHNNTWIDLILVDDNDTILESERKLRPFPSRHGTLKCDEETDSTQYPQQLHIHTDASARYHLMTSAISFLIKTGQLSLSLNQS